MEYWEKIRSLREDKDIKQSVIAELLGVNQSYYSKQERNEKPFQVWQIYEIAKYYNVSADYILGLPKGLNWPR